jgi:hypothetical protein
VSSPDPDWLKYSEHPVSTASHAEIRERAAGSSGTGRDEDFTFKTVCTPTAAVSWFGTIRLGMVGSASCDAPVGLHFASRSPPG